MTITGCESNEDTIVSNLVSEFEAHGIEWKEKENLSKPFNFSGSKNKQYEFNGGSIYVIYGFEGNETIKKTILDELTKHFAETEYPYDVKTLYTDSFHLIFIANSNDLDTKKTIESIFQSIN